MKKQITLIAGVAVLICQPLLSQTTLWNDSFEGASFNPNWAQVATTTVGATAPSIGSNIVSFQPGNTNDFSRSFIATTRSESGDALFLGNRAFDFFSHPLTLTISDLDLGANPASGDKNFFALISDRSVSQLSDAHIRGTTNTNGVYLRVTKTSTITQVQVTEKIGNTITPFSYSILDNVTPSQIDLDLDSLGWTLTISGATFMDATTSRSNTWQDITSTAVDLSENATFSMGATNFVRPDSAYTVNVGNLEITAIPEPTTYALALGLLSLVAIVLLRRRK